MRAVIQRVKSASVTIEGKVTGDIGKGYLILLGIEDADDDNDIEWLSRKISTLRIFDNEEGRMNSSLDDVGGDALVVSQFTLHAKTKKGTRPSYVRAAKPDKAIPVYEKFVEQLKVAIKGKVETGEFGAGMDVELINDGPVTLIIDTKNKE